MKRRKPIFKPCEICGDKFKTWPCIIENNRGKYCSKECYYAAMIGRKPPKTAFKKGQNIGKKCPNWKGGITYSEGYAYVKTPKHPTHKDNSYILRSHLVLEKHMGILLTSNDIVHHINGIKDDDRIDNLQLLSRSQHIEIHRKDLHDARKIAS